MNAQDLAAAGLAAGDLVDVFAAGPGAAERCLSGLLVVAYPIARGSCAAYYPEAMPLIALQDHDPQSFTPAYKSTWIRILKSQ
jgi:anaerobic selenocysteine-containing dehydrogenase